jgi:hypothetical protein
VAVVRIFEQSGCRQHGLAAGSVARISSYVVLAPDQLLEPLEQVGPGFNAWAMSPEAPTP